MAKKIIKKETPSTSSEVDLERQQAETESTPESAIEINIGSEIVSQSPEPTKTVEEMQALFSNPEDASTEQENGDPQSPAMDSVSQTTVTPSSEPFIMPPDLVTAVDENGNEEFDPTKHCVDANGNPVKTKAGKFRRKRGKSGTSVKQESQFESFTTPAPPSTIQLVQTILDSTTMLVAAGLGDEWKMNPDERVMLVDAYSRYMHFRGWDSMASPEMVLLTVTFAYMMPRIMTEKNLKSILAWSKGTNAHSNSGQTGARQNLNSNGNRPPSGNVRPNGNNPRPAASDGLGGTLNISEINERFNKGSS